MPLDELAQFSVVVSAADESQPDAAALEEFALAVQQTLTDAGVTRVERSMGEAGPEGTRSVELLGVLTLIVTAVQTGEALVKTVRAIQACLRRVDALRARVRTGSGVIEIAADSPVEPIVQALLAAPATVPARVRSALIVANSSYDDPLLAGLRGPAKDADALARALGDPAIGDFDVDLLMDAEEGTIRRRIARFFANRDRDDVLLLYFSCHGVKDQRGRLYLAARDTELATVSATAIATSFVNDQMAQTQSQRVVLVLDCCYSGAFNRGAPTRGDQSVHIGDEFSAGTGRMVLTASSATEYAFEGGDLAQSEGQPSVFTTALVSGLTSGDADLGGDGEISVDELYDYTYRQVRRHTPDQTPMKWTFGVEGSLVIARSVKQVALPSEIAADLASDRPALRVEGVQALARLRSEGNAALRDRALAELRRLQTEDDSERVRTAAAQALGEAPGPAPVVPKPRAPEPTAPPAVDKKALTLSHPTLLSVLIGVTLVTLVQLIQIVILGQRLYSYAGVNFLLVAPVAAVIGIWQMRRAGQPRWALLMVGALVLTVGQWLIAYSRVRSGSEIIALFTFTGLNADAVGSLLLRWMFAVPALAWYAVAGPAAVVRPPGKHCGAKPAGSGVDVTRAEESMRQTWPWWATQRAPCATSAVSPTRFTAPGTVVRPMMRAARGSATTMAPVWNSYAQMS